VALNAADERGWERHSSRFLLASDSVKTTAKGNDGDQLRLHGWYIDIRSCDLRIYNPVGQRFEAAG
jgi:carbonic anhydrase